MKKISLGILLVILSVFANGQGLEGIIVEKYYISNAADSTGSIGVLPVGSVTYRLYVDMLPGYKFQAAYGVSGHTLLFTTSTSFFNNEDRGATTPTYTKNQARGNTVMLDSWLSVGAACSGNFGILKTEDAVAGGTIIVNNSVPPILQNNDPLAGIALTTQDGIYVGTPEAVTFVGITTADLALFDATSNIGNSFSTSNGSWASLNGSTGPIPAINKVLIAQITTNGVFHYELNVQIGTPTGGVENYVASNPIIPEITIPSLTGTLGGSAANVLPTTSITSPANGAAFLTGAVVAIAANAADADGTVSSVEFFVDGTTSIGVDNTAPYTVNWTSTTGSHILTSKATDNSGGQTTSAGVTINVSNNSPPTCNITAPANGSSFTTGAVVAITATATDNGSVASVEFFIDGVSLSIDNSSPYTAIYNSTSGSHIITAKATDNQGAQTTSLPVNITVGNNIPPTVNITAPAGGALYTAPAVVNITADGTDADGTVSLVEFYVNGILVGSDATSPYSYNWTSTIGTANLTARVTDDLGAHTTSSAVLISVADPNIPYKIVTSRNICLPTSFCLPVVAIDTVQNVIGYDVVLSYNKIKVHPTGVIAVANALINPSFVDVAQNTDTANGTMNISLFFNATAPANTKFSGQGNVFCVEFVKNAAFTSVDSSAFSISFMQESYFTGVATKNVDPGKYITYRDTAFTGSLRFWTGNVNLGYDFNNPNQFLITNVFGNNASCTNKSLIAVQPDATGHFDYSIVNGQDIMVERDIAGNTNVQPVMNGFDALLLNKALVKDPTFVPSIYQMIAMDVNTDGIVSAGDVSQLNQRIVLMIPEFKQAWNYNASGVSNGQLSKDWLFIDSTVTSSAAYHISATFPQDDGVGFSIARTPVVPFCLPVPVTNFSTCPQILTAVYKGILIGDINGNYSTVGSGGNYKVSNDSKIVFDLENQILENGFVDIPVFCNAENMNAMDFAMQYDESKFEFVSVVENANHFQHIAHFNSDDRILRFTSNSMNQFFTDRSSVYIRFRGDVNVSESDLSSVTGYLNGNPAGIEFKNSKKVNYQQYDFLAYPNPASNSVNIIVSEDANMQLSDVSGKIIMDRNIPGRQTNEINTELLENGIYLIKISNNNFSSVKRIVISK